MVSQNNEVNYLIHLLSLAVNEKENDLQGEEINYPELFDLAKKHQVYNIIYPIIQSSENVPQSEKDSWRNYNLTEITRMITVNSERQAIFSELEKSGVNFMPLKGLIIKSYYPKESMRQMSDNDILFDAEKRDVVASIMKKRGYKTTATGENSDDYFKAPYSTFEFHRTLFFEEKDFCPHFDNLFDRAERDGSNSCIFNMGLDDVYIYGVCHMYKHYSTAGCGVRFLLDNYLFLKKESENLDWDYINSSLDKYSILDFEKKTRVLAFKLFDGGELDDEETRLFETFINFGIYGDGKISLAKKLESIAENGEGAKKKYILSRLFPSRSKMIKDYRVLESKPYLLPAYYVYRLFKGAANSKKTIEEIKTVSSIEIDK